MKFREFLDHVEIVTMNEKFDKETKINPEKKGMFKGKTKAELEKERTKLKAKQAKKKADGEKADPKTSTKIKEVDFALRAKSGWGKIKEEVMAGTSTKSLLTESPADTYYITTMKNRFADMEKNEKTIKEDEMPDFGQEKSAQEPNAEAPAPEAGDSDESSVADRLAKLEQTMEKIKAKFPDVCEEAGADDSESEEAPQA